MKICWLLPSDTSGGITPMVLSCCRQAAQAGYATTMLLLHNPTWISSNDFKVATLGLPAGASDTPLRLQQWLLDNPQDIIFLNSCDEFDTIIPYLPPNIKCVYVVHDTASIYWQKALAEEDHLEAIVAVSETVASKFRGKLKTPEKVSVIYNGCVFPEIGMIQKNKKDDLIFLGGETPLKGAFDVLSLWKELAKLGFKGELHWFGRLTPKFANKIKQLPNSDRIRVYGHVSRDIIFSTAASAKVALMLSRTEAFGMATIEAMGMGCVPVAWDIETGTKEITTADETALFAPLSDIQTLAKKVMYACEKYELFNKAVIERARSKFNEENMWDGYNSLINHLFTLKPIQRSKFQQQPEPFKRPVRGFQLLPPGIRSFIRGIIGRSPTLGYWLRDKRGW